MLAASGEELERVLAEIPEAVDETWMRRRCDRIDPTDYESSLSDEDSTTPSTGSSRCATSTAGRLLPTEPSSSPSIGSTRPTFAGARQRLAPTRPADSAPTSPSAALRAFTRTA
jgi:hypothetical protein